VAKLPQLRVAMSHQYRSTRHVKHDDSKICTRDTKQTCLVHAANRAGLVGEIDRWVSEMGVAGIPKGDRRTLAVEVALKLGLARSGIGNERVMAGLPVESACCSLIWASGGDGILVWCDEVHFQKPNISKMQE
jgi:hypothetical protein